MMAGGIGEFEVRPAPLVSLETQPAPRLRCCSAADRAEHPSTTDKKTWKENTHDTFFGCSQGLLMLMCDDEHARSAVPSPS